MPITRITVALTDFDSYNSIRVTRPLAWPGIKATLWSAGLHVETKPFKEISLQGLAATDCLVLHGVPSPNLLNLLRKCPCRFATFQDDLMTDMPDWNPSQVTEAQKMALAWVLEHACAIVATTQPLADALGYPKKTIVQGNLEDFSEPVVGNAYRMKRSIFVGGNSHAADIELLNDLNWSGQTVIWSSCLPSSRTAMYRNKLGGMEMRPDLPSWGWIAPTCSHEQYGVWLKNVAPWFGVGLAPLVDCPFNRCKSILKVVEYLKCGWVPVVSDAPPYRCLPDDVCVKVGGPNRRSSWTACVEHAAAHPEIAARGWEWARSEWSYQEKWRGWVDAYSFIGSKI